LQPLAIGSTDLFLPAGSQYQQAGDSYIKNTSFPHLFILDDNRL
jgi:hypothetical protein